MRAFEANPESYDMYVNVDDDENVYRFAYGTIDEAYAIRESNESFDDFMGEVNRRMRRKYGRHINFQCIEDVTGTFDEE